MIIRSHNLSLFVEMVSKLSSLSTSLTFHFLYMKAFVYKETINIE